MGVSSILDDNNAAAFENSCLTIKTSYLHHKYDFIWRQSSIGSKVVLKKISLFCSKFRNREKAFLQPGVGQTHCFEFGLLESIKNYDSILFLLKYMLFSKFKDSGKW